jgi:hypothetical protein
MDATTYIAPKHTSATSAVAAASFITARARTRAQAHSPCEPQPHAALRHPSKRSVGGRTAWQALLHPEHAWPGQRWKRRETSAAKQHPHGVYETRGSACTGGDVRLRCAAASERKAQKRGHPTRTVRLLCRSQAHATTLSAPTSAATQHSQTLLKMSRSHWRARGNITQTPVSSCVARRARCALPRRAPWTRRARGTRLLPNRPWRPPAWLSRTRVSCARLAAAARAVGVKAASVSCVKPSHGHGAHLRV